MTLKNRIARLERTASTHKDLLLTDVGLIRVTLGTGKFLATGRYDTHHPRNANGNPMTSKELRDYLIAHNALDPAKAELLNSVIADDLSAADDEPAETDRRVIE